MLLVYYVIIFERFTWTKLSKKEILCQTVPRWLSGLFQFFINIENHYIEILRFAQHDSFLCFLFNIRNFEFFFKEMYFQKVEGVSFLKNLTG